MVQECIRINANEKQNPVVVFPHLHLSLQIVDDKVVIGDAVQQPVVVAAQVAVAAVVV